VTLAGGPRAALRLVVAPQRTDPDPGAPIDASQPRRYPLRAVSPHDSSAEWNLHLAQARLPEILALLELRLGNDLRARISAEDILQEALLQAWRDRESFVARGEQSFRRWLITLALNRLRDAIDHHGAGRRTPAAEVGSAALVDAADSSTPSRTAIRREHAEAVRRALLAVPAEDRDVVRLRLLEERPLGEVARELGLPLTTVRQRHRRGTLRYHAELRAQLRSSSAAT